VIPATFGALLGFLGLVAPGLVYNTITERRRSPRSESTFAEVSRVALTSLGFSLIGFAILWLLQRYSGLALPSIGLWLMRGSKYVAINLGRVFFGLVAQVALACGLAAAVAWILTRRSRSRFTNDTAFGSVFRRWAPKGFGNWVHVKLEDETEFWGYERGHHDRGDPAARAIVLQGKALMQKLPSEFDWRPIGKSWEFVIIDVARIRYMRVIYRNDAGELRGMVTAKCPEGQLRDLGSQPTHLRSSASSSPSAASVLDKSNPPAKTVGTELGPGHTSDRRP
jgi:Family of unknown function (DUF6338)